MYKLAAPVMNWTLERADRVELLKLMRKMGVERVFLALSPYLLDEKLREREFALLRDNVRFFHDAGLEVGSWMWAFLPTGAHPYVPMRTLGGQDVDNEICPLDANFLPLATEYVRRVAEAGVDLVMYDDDFRFGWLVKEPCCVCPLHLERIGEKLGHKVEETAVREAVLRGEGNAIRDAFFAVNGDALVEFAKAVRAAADAVNPAVRMGVCSCMSSWDIDGNRAKEIDRILAGKNRPFRRLIGAPYWAVNKSWGNRLSDIIELERMERSWHAGEETEIFSEGDVYPRPRTACPGAYLELFDTALRADGSLDGILKYAFNYTSRAVYDTGYVEAHADNAPLYAAIDAHFSGKQCVGIRVYESPAKLAKMNLTRGGQMEAAFFPASSRLLSEGGFPTVYDGEGVCGIAFGQCVREVPRQAMKRGLVLDAAAARILEEMGIDTGVVRREDSARYSVELFGNGEAVPADVEAQRVVLKDGAVARSWFQASEFDETRCVAAHSYVNAEGDRFFVYDFDMLMTEEVNRRSFARWDQLAQVIAEVFGAKLPAHIRGCPDVYVLAKRAGDEMAVGVWNICPDAIRQPRVELDGEYRSIEGIGCEARLEGNVAVLSKLHAFEFAGFVVRK